MSELTPEEQAIHEIMSAADVQQDTLEQEETPGVPGRMRPTLIQYRSPTVLPQNCVKERLVWSQNPKTHGKLISTSHGLYNYEA